MIFFEVGLTYRNLVFEICKFCLISNFFIWATLSTNKSETFLDSVLPMLSKQPKYALLTTWKKLCFYFSGMCTICVRFVGASLITNKTELFFCIYRVIFFTCGFWMSHNIKMAKELKTKFLFNFFFIFLVWYNEPTSLGRLAWITRKLFDPRTLTYPKSGVFFFFFYFQKNSAPSC